MKYYKQLDYYKGEQMRDIALGIMIGIIICMVILCYIPLTETELSCEKCGSPSFWFHKAKESYK
tara:strand:- start:70 stop:261 length:192 start_codon:yes stop_codon:yes gene_type:complete